MVSAFRMDGAQDTIVWYLERDVINMLVLLLHERRKVRQAFDAHRMLPFTKAHDRIATGIAKARVRRQVAHGEQLMCHSDQMMIQ